MWVDESDATQLAQRLRLGPRELVTALGGPWRIAWRIPEREAEAPGTLFIGRAGPSVAILVGDGPDPIVTVGGSRGEWTGPTTLQWTVQDPLSVLATPPSDSAAADVDAFLADLASAVEAAFEAARPRLVVCRYCGVIVAPEHSLDASTCMGCATTVLGIAY